MMRNAQTRYLDIIAATAPKVIVWKLVETTMALIAANRNAHDDVCAKTNEETVVRGRKDTG